MSSERLAELPTGSAGRTALASADGWVAAFSPATVANLGPGFDVLGMAVDRPGDGVAVRLVPRGSEGTRGITVRAGFADVPIPTDPTRNTAAVAAEAVLREANAATGLEVVVFKGLPIGSGLGSSGASAVAAAVATNHALGSPLDRPGLLRACLRAEAAACGSAHGDNVAPAIWGGIVLLDLAEDPPAVRSLPVPAGLSVALVTPRLEVRTSDARGAMPREVPLAVTMRTAARLGRLVDALHRGDLPALGRALDDEVHVPVRSAFITGYASVRVAGLQAGALGVSISGSGPTVFALCDAGRAAAVSQAMADAFRAISIEAIAWSAQAGCPGAHTVPPEEVAELIRGFRAVA